MKEKLINNGYIETDAIICGCSQGSEADKGGTWSDPEVMFSTSNKSLDIIMQMTSDGSFYDLNNIKKFKKKETMLIKIFIIIFFSILLFLITYFVIFGGKNVYI